MKTHLVVDLFVFVLWCVCVCLWCVCDVFVLYEKKTCVYAPSVVLINNILCYNPNLK